MWQLCTHNCYITIVLIYALTEQRTLFECLLENYPGNYSTELSNVLQMRFFVNPYTEPDRKRTNEQTKERKNRTERVKKHKLTKPNRTQHTVKDFQFNWRINL